MNGRARASRERERDEHPFREGAIGIGIVAIAGIALMAVGLLVSVLASLLF